jgi:hypothetical protein
MVFIIVVFVANERFASLVKSRAGHPASPCVSQSKREA